MKERLTQSRFDVNFVRKGLVPVVMQTLVDTKRQRDPTPVSGAGSSISPLFEGGDRIQLYILLGSNGRKYCVGRKV